MTDDPTVIATAKWVEPPRRALDGFWRLVVPRCPFCGGKHLHGGGNGVVPHVGHRVADCTRGTGYYLTLASPPPPHG